MDLSAAYDTVNHRRLLSKVLKMTGDVHLTDLIRTLLESRRFFVVLNGKKSRWRRHENGLPQGSVLAPTLFNIYTNDQPYTPPLAASSTQMTCASLPNNLGLPQTNKHRQCTLTGRYRPSSHQKGCCLPHGTHTTNDRRQTPTVPSPTSC